MTKVQKNNKSQIGVLSLDTLEVTSDYYLSKSHESLHKSTVLKGRTLSKLMKIIDVSSEVRKKKYWKTYHCKNVLIQDGDRLIGSLCRKRWCQTCNRIKTAELVNAYKNPLLGFEEPYMVTLTAPTVKARQLDSEIVKRIKSFQRVKDNIRKNHGIKLNGMRKLEVTYNSKTDKFHPHFHFIIDGLGQANKLLSLWMAQFPKAKLTGQDIRIITESNDKAGGLLEVFKYATKDVVNDTTDAKALDIIYSAIEGKRVYQAFGNVSKCKEPREELNERMKADFTTLKKDIYVYDNDKLDYVNSSNELLIGTLDINYKMKVDAIINSEKTV